MRHGVSLGWARGWCVDEWPGCSYPCRISDSRISAGFEAVLVWAERPAGVEILSTTCGTLLRQPIKSNGVVRLTPTLAVKT